MEALAADVRSAIRFLCQTPAFTLTALAVVALGIGANTAIFTVVNTVLLQSLPYPDADRIVNITRGDGGTVSPPMASFWMQQNLPVDDLTAYDNASAGVNLGGGDRPELASSLHVSRNYFRLFGAAPIAGRTFTTEEDRPGGARVLLMSYGLWQRRFGGQRSILGRTVDVAGTPYTVIGILSPSFRPNPATDLWLPMQLDPESRNEAHTLMAAGRLRSGVTLAQANAQMKVIGKRYVQAHPEQVGDDSRPSVKPMQQRLTGDARPVLLILLGAVGLVLLIACANVANLLLVRAAGRQKEMAVRAALGAGRLRMVRQLLTESLLLAVAGSALGLLLGICGVRLLLSFAPGNLPRAEELASAPLLNLPVVFFTVGLAALTGVLFGILPALQASRIDLASALNEASGRSGSGRKQNRARGVLAAAEMALAVVLLCGALLLVRSFVALHGVQPGFDIDNVLSLETSLAGSRYGTASQADRLGRLLADRVEQIPGVESAALTNSIPLHGDMDFIFIIPGRPLPPGEKFHGDVEWRFVTSRYFDVLRIPLRAGRLFHETEPGKTIVINEAMARKFWPKENLIGQHILMGAGLPAFDQGSTEIIGVVGDTHEFGLNDTPPPLMYQPYSQVSDAAVALVSRMMPAAFLVRTRAGVAPSSVAAAVEGEFISKDIQLAPAKLRPLRQVAADSMARQSFSVLLLGVFAAIALVLAAVGVYGVMSYSVQQRTREIGIRSALGATAADTMRLVVGQGMKLALMGVAAGLLSAYWLTGLLTSLLFGISPADPVTFASVAGILILVALIATGIPALRASHLDPLTALREE